MTTRLKEQGRDRLVEDAVAQQEAERSSFGGSFRTI